MNIVAINGSHRGRKGYTHFLIEKLFDGARAGAANCEEIILSELNIKNCTGCFTCQREGHLRRCIYEGKDDAESVFKKMREADIIVFATPVYVFAMSSLIKNLLERYNATADCNDFKISRSGLFFHDIDTALCSKPFITIICQDNIEKETHRNIVDYFKTYARFMDARYAGSLVRTAGMIAGYGSDKTKFDKYPILTDIYAAFYDAGLELTKNGTISRSVQKRANRQLVPVPPFVKLLARVPAVRDRIAAERTKMMG